MIPLVMLLLEKSLLVMIQLENIPLEKLQHEMNLPKIKQTIRPIKQTITPPNN
jgi:hypothetical protein